MLENTAEGGICEKQNIPGPGTGPRTRVANSLTMLAAGTYVQHAADDGCLVSLYKLMIQEILRAFITATSLSNSSEFTRTCCGCFPFLFALQSQERG